MIRLALALCLLAGAASAEEGQPLDPGQYPPEAIPVLLRKNPCKPAADGYEVKDILFSAEETYKGITRETPAKHLELMKRWLVKIGAAGQAPNFDRGLRLDDGKKSWWLPIPSDILKDLEDGVKKGESVVFYMTYVGCVGTEPVLAVEDFSAPDYDDLDEDATSVVT